MEYTQIKALVPEGEHFDTTAINEGVWLSEGHLNKLEESLSGLAAAKASLIQQHETAIATLNKEHETVLSGVKTENDAVVSSINEKLTNQALQAQQATEGLNTANETIAARDARIVELEAKVAKLENEAPKPKQSAGKDKDEVNGGGQPAHLNPDNSLNKAAEGFFGKK
jgi:chromosome segregation ATPase